MSAKLCIVVCSSFIPEVKCVIESGNYSDVVIKGYHSTCIEPQFNSDLINEISEKYASQFSKVVFVGSSCHVGKKKITGENNKTEYRRLSQCFELLLNRSTIEHLITKGHYLISNGWLRDYKKHIIEWGFDPESAKKYFQESITKLTLLETGLPEDYLPPLQKISDYMGIPYEIMPVGLSHCKLFLDSIIFQWREDNERKALNEKIALATNRSADYALAFNELKNLVDLIDEEEIIKKIFNLINMLFAPSNIVYISVENNIQGEQILFKDENLSEERLSDYNFRMELSHQNNLVGIFEILKISFPQYIDRYKEVSRIVSGVGGLAIANSRKYKQIKLNEEHLKKYSEELKQLIVSRDKFFSIIAHDLKSPFSGLLGLTEMMATESENFTLSEFVNISRSLNVSADNLFKLLNNLLEWALLQQNAISFNLGRHALSLLVDQSIATIQTRASQKAISISNKIDKSYYVSVDDKMITTVLRNLLSNAIKFTDKNGFVTINALQLENDMIQVSVSDTGVGIANVDLSRLFIIGEKVNSKGTEGEISTGLGLILCKEFVEKHGGTIWVESEKGKGSTFFFTIPNC